MKKLLSIAVCASAVSAFATLEPVPVEVGSVGVTKIRSTLTNTVVAVSYSDLAGDGAITVSNIVKTTNLTVGDRLHIFTGSSTYETYVLTASGTGKYWARTVAWTLDANGVLTETETAPSSENTLAAGVGFWLVRNTTGEGAWGGSAFDFYTYGKPTTAALTTASRETKLIGNPLDVAATPEGRIEDSSYRASYDSCWYRLLVCCKGQRYDYRLDISTRYSLTTHLT